MGKRLFIISNRLPVSIETTDKSATVKLSSGGLVSAIGSYLEKKENLNEKEYDEKYWLGVPGCTSALWHKVVNEIPAEGYKYLPVFVNKKDYEAYYNGMSNSVLWALFHYFPSFAEYNNHHYDQYQKINQEFLKVLLPCLQPGDVLWIHDYHLLPLAALIRNAMPNVTIGFFLHIPFPSYEIFRIMPKRWQRELLSGMLGSDLIGFHTADYACHFLTSVKKILGLGHHLNTLSWQNRLVKVEVFPISIDFDKFYNAFDREDVKTQRELIKSNFQGQKIIFSADRLDYSKGVYNRLRAYEQFLERFPEYHEKVVFIIVIVPSRDAISKYAERKKMIDEYIGNLNSRIGNFHWQPVVYQYNSLNFNELTAMYTSCDLALITPIRDGMNLVAKEFVASRQDKAGVLVLSEMTGAAIELKEALAINPTDIGEIAEQIKVGLEMDAEEQSWRIEAMQNTIKNYNVTDWAGDFLQQLDQVQQMQSDTKQPINLVDEKLLFEKYSQSQKRLILLDYDGTLTPLVSLPELASPDLKLLQLLKELSDDENNLVYIISGRDVDTLNNWLGSLNLNLIAEHGAWIKLARGQWKTNTTLKTSWKNPVRQVLETATTKCEGSFVEEKSFGLAWHYRNANQGLAKQLVKDLLEELQALAGNLDVDILNGNKVIEVKNRGINKGLAVEDIIRNDLFDFILACGDDTTDEDMFNLLLPHEEAFTIKVGNNASYAKFHIADVNKVLALLNALNRQNTTEVKQISNL